MNCPPEIADIILDIIRTGILHIRHLGWENDPNRCAVEANHIHNLPTLVRDYALDQLQYYWEIERPEFINDNKSTFLESFEPLWSELSSHVSRLRDRREKTVE